LFLWRLEVIRSQEAEGVFLENEKGRIPDFFYSARRRGSGNKKTSWDLTALIGPQNLKIFVADTGERSEPPKGIQKGENWCDRD
jgi:hypothetical protein